MPGRRGILFSQKDIEKVTIGKPLFQNGGRGKLFAGKIHLKQEEFPAGMRRAQKVILKEVEDLEEAKRNVAIADLLRKHGLPVPRMGAVTHEGKFYIATQPFLSKGKSKITPINTVPKSFIPDFLANLKLPEHETLIKNLARDLATINNLKIFPIQLDFWGFYERSDGALDRLVFDLECLSNTFYPTDLSVVKEQALVQLRLLQLHFKPKGFELFERTFKQYLVIVKI